VRKNLNTKDLLHRIVVALVDSPDEVQVKSADSEQGTTFLVTVAPTDVGKVIGKGGRNARALRSLLSAFGMKLKVRYTLNILSRQ
jgi:predicted RNA-binding protein YlqC (UPF0109 family)